jgi:hypothetical protein
MMSKRMVVPLMVVSILVFSCSALAGFAVGPNLFISLPQEDFANVSETGGGLGVKFLFSPPLLSTIAVRADFAVAFYGSETYSDEVAGFEVDVETRNESIQFTVGPHFQTPMGPVRLYGAPMAGVYNYRTVVELEGTDRDRTESSTTKFGWSFGGGMLVKVFSNPTGKFTLDIDLGAKYHTIKDAIETEIDGVVEKSNANDVSLHTGVLFSF